MFFDSESMLDFLFLDLGNVRDDIPKVMSKVLTANEITLKHMWDSIGLGKHIPIRVGNNKDRKLKPKWLTYEQTEDAIQKNDIVYWVPQSFYGKHRATVKLLSGYRCLVADLDPKIDLYFWTKLTEIFKKWNSGETIDGIPAPAFFSLTGNGIHLYWVFKEEEATSRTKALATATLKLVLLKISSFFDKPVDQIHIVQAFRVPGAKTKDGYGVCRIFEVVNGTKNISLRDFAVRCFGDDSCYVDSYLDKTCRFSDLWSRLEPYGIAAGVLVNKKKKKVEELLEPESDFCEEQPIQQVIPDKIVVNGIDRFDPKSIGIFSNIIDNEKSCIKKNFAKRLILEVKMQYPIQEGYRNNRLFGLSVGLAKCGCSKKTIVRIVDNINNSFCKEPLSEKDVSNCYVRPHRYVRAREERLREWLGIDHWTSFIKKETTMTRKQAARKASKFSHKSSVRKLRDAYASFGFDISVSELCRKADIERKTFYRYKKSGVLQEEVLGYFINCANFDSVRLQEIAAAMNSVKNGSELVKVSEPKIAEQYILAMTSKEIAGNSFRNL